MGKLKRLLSKKRQNKKSHSKRSSNPLQKKRSKAKSKAKSKSKSKAKGKSEGCDYFTSAKLHNEALKEEGKDTFAKKCEQDWLNECFRKNYNDEEERDCCLNSGIPNWYCE